jgi:hypothetical protein
MLSLLLLCQVKPKCEVPPSFEEKLGWVVKPGCEVTAGREVKLWCKVKTGQPGVK